MLQHWAREGEFYIGGLVLLIFVEPFMLALYELAQNITVYVELAFVRPMLYIAFSSIL